MSNKPHKGILFGGSFNTLLCTLTLTIIDALDPIRPPSTQHFLRFLSGDFENWAFRMCSALARKTLIPFFFFFFVRIRIKRLKAVEQIAAI